MKHLTKMNKNNKFRMAAAAILNYIFPHYLLIIAHNCTKFGMSITFEVLNTKMPK